MPKRIQMTRQRPWRQDHPDAVIVARPTKWGNPIRLDGPFDCFNVLKLAGPKGARSQKEWHRDACAIAFRIWQMSDLTPVSKDAGDPLVEAMAIKSGPYPTHDEIRAELRGRDLACWCPLDAPCHADVLLEIAND